jgi:hypothetical protein
MVTSDSSGFLWFLGSFGVSSEVVSLGWTRRASQRAMRRRDWLRFSKKEIANPALGIPAALGFVRLSHRRPFAPATPDGLSLAPAGGKVAIVLRVLRMVHTTAAPLARARAGRDSGRGRNDGRARQPLRRMAYGRRSRSTLAGAQSPILPNPGAYSIIGRKSRVLGWG